MLLEDILKGYCCVSGISQRGNNYGVGRGRGMQKKLKRKDRGRGRGGNKGSDGFHEVCGIKVKFLMQLFQMTGCLALTEVYL